jgi:predicted dithiol-disulfide oxidoreductase (DUF899 family)
MPKHRTGTREELETAQGKLRQREQELATLSDELTKERREVPWDFGLEIGFQQFLDRAPVGAKEGVRMRRHDGYDNAAGAPPS